MREAFLILVLVAYASATAIRNITSDDPCKTALQWEGRYSEWDHNDATNNRYKISFDGLNKRKYIEEEQKSMRPGRRLFKFLILFDEQAEYKIDPKFNRCTKLPMGPWRNFSIPNNATFEDEYDIGGPKGNLAVTEWSDRQPARSRETWIGGFTKVDCWPVFEIFTFNNDTVSMGFTTRFFDLTPGIQNTSVFDVPEICKQTTVVRTPTPETPDRDDDGPGLWNSIICENQWLSGWAWVKKLANCPQRIDFGGLVPQVKIPTVDVPAVPDFEVPDQNNANPKVDIPTFKPNDFTGKLPKLNPKWDYRKP